MRGMGGMSVALASFEIGERQISKFGLYTIVYALDPLSNIILCSLNEKQGKENLGQKRLSDNTKVAFGTTKDHG